MNNTTNSFFDEPLIQNNYSLKGNGSLGSRWDHNTTMGKPPGSNPFSGNNKMVENILIAFACIFIPFLYWISSPSVPEARFRRGAQIRERARRRFMEQRQRRSKQVEDPIERAKLIEKSLIMKKVMVIDHNGNLSVGDVCNKIDPEKGGSACEELDSFGQAEKVHASQHPTYVEEEESTCVICLEPFRIGDIVSWSRFSSSECLHVFHKDCITEWLQNPSHDDCPSCRHVILPLNGDKENVKDMEDAPTSSVFTIIRGLVTGARARCSTFGQTADTTPTFDEGDMEASVASVVMEDSAEGDAEDSVEFVMASAQDD